MDRCILRRSSGQERAVRSAESQSNPMHITPLVQRGVMISGLGLASRQSSWITVDNINEFQGRLSTTNSDLFDFMNAQ